MSSRDHDRRPSELDGHGRAGLKAWLAENATSFPFIVAVLVLAAGIYVAVMWSHRRPSLGARASGIESICALRADTPLITVDEVKHSVGSGGGFTRRHYFVSFTDPKTGKRLRRQRLDREMQCLLYDDGLVWLAGGSELRAYRVTTGDLVYRKKDLLAKLPVGYHSSGYSRDHAGAKHLYIRGTDGRDYFVSTKGGLTVSTEPPPMTETKAQPPASGDDGVAIVGTGPRRFIEADGVRVGSSDFLQPQLIANPEQGGQVWPAPRSVLVVEPIALGSRTYRVTRLGLDGKKLWTSSGSGPALDRTSPFWPLPDASLLLYVTKTAAVVAIDPGTGSERYRVHL